MARTRATNNELNLSFKSYTNSGSGGGTASYLVLGDFKILIVKGISSNSGGWRDVDFTPVGFTSPPSVVANTLESATPAGWVELATVGGSSGLPSAAGCAVLTRTSTGANSSTTVNLIAVGI